MRFVNQVKSGLVLASVSAFALADTTFDTTAVLTIIASVTTAVAAIGAAVFGGPVIMAKAWKWMTRAA